jgi:hypothetical protein
MQTLRGFVLKYDDGTGSGTIIDMTGCTPGVRINSLANSNQLYFLHVSNVQGFSDIKIKRRKFRFCRELVFEPGEVVEFNVDASKRKSYMQTALNITRTGQRVRATGGLVQGIEKIDTQKGER